MQQEIASAQEKAFASVLNNERKPPLTYDALRQTGEVKICQPVHTGGKIH